MNYITITVETMSATEQKIWDDYELEQLDYSWETRLLEEIYGNEELDFN